MRSAIRLGIGALVLAACGAATPADTPEPEPAPAPTGELPPLVSDGNEHCLGLGGAPNVAVPCNPGGLPTATPEMARRVVFASIRVTDGSYEVAIARRYLKALRGRLLACADAATPALAGDVTLALAFDAESHLTSADVTGAGDDAVHACVARSLARLRIAKLHGQAAFQLEATVSFLP